MNFATFFESIHGYAPFPWQVAAAHRLRHNEPLRAITVPTGCGKTAMIDAALYHAAYGGPRRIFFIIDRRVVVDEAAARAEHLRSTLEASRGGLRDVADRLGKVRVVRLRGGVHTDESWAWYPEATTIVLSTVDQVGSRLLHRGYGVSSRMWPVHAGFVGNDALYLVDEAHLSKPFAATVQAAAANGADVRLIEMSATLETSATEGTLTLSEEDYTTPVLTRRLEAIKRVTLERAPAPDTQFIPKLAEHAQALASTIGPGAVVGVVVNQVRTARRAWERLRKNGFEAELLIGRTRAADRDRLLDRLMPRVRTGRTRNTDVPPLLIVATQTIEVGADLDFDGLVTEAAPLSALRQRFGRVDRLGERGESENVILVREPHLDEKKAATAPVYGHDVRATWRWLEQVSLSKGTLDMGVAAMARIVEKAGTPDEAIAHCPELLPTHVDLLSQTGPAAPLFDPAPWLHGPQRSSRDITILWRADLDTEHPEAWAEQVRERPPQTREAVQVPIGLLRDLLLDSGRSDASDVEGADDVTAERSESVERPVLRWRGSDDCEVLRRLDFRPGDVIVVPAEYGGCDEYGWFSARNQAVPDIADECALEETRSPFILRLHPALDDWLGSQQQTIRAAIAALHAASLPDPEEGVDEDRLDEAWESLRNELSKVDHPYVERLGHRYHYTALSQTSVILKQPRLEDTGGAVSGGVPVTLDAHSQGVAQRASEIAARDPKRELIRRAGEMHDYGKLAPAFQNLLHGDPIRAAAGPALAKSGLRTHRAQRVAWQRAGVPRGFRHELHSLDFIEEEDSLLHHLVAVHHGYGRPWFPPVEDPQAPGAHHAALDAHWAGAFARVRREHNPWRLSGLELFLRAADIRRSKEETSGD